jgi:hypothetical protein
MKRILLISATFLVANAAFAYKPAVEREFSEAASTGCQNRDGDFIVRGMVSSADENTLVLHDPNNARSTMSVTLPGRGPFARIGGVFGRSKHEASDERLNELRSSRTPVTVTLKCKGDGTPTARDISYQTADGTRESISY